MSSLISSYASRKRHGLTCTNTADSSRRGCGWPGWLPAPGLSQRLAWSVPPLPREALSETCSLLCLCVHAALPRVTQTCVAHHDRPPNRTENWSYILLTGEKVTQRNSPGKEDWKEIYWDDNLSINYFFPQCNFLPPSLHTIFHDLSTTMAGRQGKWGL